MNKNQAKPTFPKISEDLWMSGDEVPDENGQFSAIVHPDRIEVNYCGKTTVVRIGGQYLDVTYKYVLYNEVYVHIITIHEGGLPSHMHAFGPKDFFFGRYYTTSYETWAKYNKPRLPRAEMPRVVRDPRPAAEMPLVVRPQPRDLPEQFEGKLQINGFGFRLFRASTSPTKTGSDENSVLELSYRSSPKSNDAVYAIARDGTVTVYYKILTTEGLTHFFFVISDDGTLVHRVDGTNIASCRLNNVNDVGYIHLPPSAFRLEKNGSGKDLRSVLCFFSNVIGSLVFE